MSMNETSLADKIAAIMSGSFLPPAVPVKKKKDKNKTHRKSSSLPDLPSAETESENEYSVNGDDGSDCSGPKSFGIHSSFGSNNDMHRSQSEPIFDDLSNVSKKNKSKVSFDSTLNNPTESSSSKIISDVNISFLSANGSDDSIAENKPTQSLPPRNIPRGSTNSKNNDDFTNSPVQLLESGDDFALFNSTPKVSGSKFENSSVRDKSPLKESHIPLRISPPKLSSENMSSRSTNSDGSYPSVDQNLSFPKRSAEPSFEKDAEISDSEIAKPTPSVVKGGGRIVKPSGGNGRFYIASNGSSSSGGGGSSSSSISGSIELPPTAPVSTENNVTRSIDDSTKRMVRMNSFDASTIAAGTPVENRSNPKKDVLSINTNSVPRQRRLSMPHTASPAVNRNKYTHELLASQNNTAPHSQQPEKLFKVAVRVRPFTADEVDNGDRRTLSKIGDNLVIVNPSAFDADPDAIAAAALALDNKNWAHVFEFDHCLWSYNAEAKSERYYDQEEVHVIVGNEIVDSVLQGTSASCFAYGHTCTGKTYSLFGNVQSLKEAKNDKYNYLKLLTDTITPDLGLIPRVFCDIVSAMQDRDGGYTKMYFSFVEIYNEKIRDLLADAATSPDNINSSRDNLSISYSSIYSTNNTPSSQYKSQMLTPQQQQQSLQQGGDSLKVREHPIFGPYIENLQKIEVFTPEEVLRLIARGLSNRSTAKSHWNAHSSRSHAIVTLELSPSKIDQSIHIFSPPTKVLIPQNLKHVNIPNTPYSNPYHSIQKKSVSSELQQDHSSLIRVQMVDLAGSEKDLNAKEEDGNGHSSMHNGYSGIGSGSRSDGVGYGTSEKERKEQKSIRKSLTTLGFIIKSLARGASAKTMPYRDTILTYLMKDALNGTNHATLLATISPSSQSYDETLATLRFAEHLCLLGKPTQVFSTTKSYTSSLLGNEKNMQGSKQSLLEDFPHIHEDLGFKKAGSVAARQLLRQTVSDPQQRIAKMIKMDYSTDKYRVAQPGFDENGYPTTAAKEKVSNVSAADLHDMDELKNSHRQLQSDFIELQIDLDAVKTDRDTLMIELKNARDRLATHDNDKSKAKIAAIQLGRALKTAETELNDLRGQMSRKEDTVERLMNDLADEKQARLNADNGYQSRIKEFLSRFESMKNEISILNGNLDDANKKYRHFQEEKNELVHAIEDLKEMINKLNRDKESLLRQIERMGDENDSLKKDLKAMKELRAFNEELVRKLKDADAHTEALIAEKESLLETIVHKDSLFSVQQQKSETIISTLNQRIVSLEIIEVSYNEQKNLGVDPEEFYRMQNQLKELFTKEGKVLYSELIDTEKLTSMIRDMRRKLHDFEALQKDYEEERSSRLAAESEKVNLAMALRSKEDEKLQLHAQIDNLKAQSQAQSTGLNQHLQAVQNQLRSENNLLKEQLTAAQREAALSREELLSSRESSQKEFSSLWKSVQELNDLDLLKDKSIQDLIADRDRAILERDHAQSRVKMLSSQCDNLQQEMEEIDNDLLAAVESEESKMSSTGNYVVLHNVSDRMMHGLARRQIDKRQQQQQQHSSGLSNSSFAADASQQQPSSGNMRMTFPGASNTSVAGTVPRPSNPNSAPGEPNYTKPLSRQPRSRSSSPSNSVNTHRSSINSSSAQVAPLPTYNNHNGNNAANNGIKLASPVKQSNSRPSNNMNNNINNNGSFSNNMNNSQSSEPNGRSPTYRDRASTTLQSIATQKQPSQKQQQNQQQPLQASQGQQQYVQDLNFSDDYTLSEKILERQIEELSDFLQDESKLKKGRHRSTLSGASSITDSFYSAPSAAMSHPYNNTAQNRGNGRSMLAAHKY